MRSLVFIGHEKADRRAQGVPEFRSRLDLHTVLLVSRGRERGLARAAAGHLGLDVGLG